MEPLAFKMLFRKKGTASAIIAIALLIALITATNSLVNNINSQTSVISGLASIGQGYLITSKNSSSLADSEVDASLINQVSNNSNVAYATSQEIIQGILTTENGSYPVNILGVNNLQAYLNNNGASIDGAVCQNQTDVDVGVILANLASISVNDSVSVTVNNNTCQLSVAGITQTTKQSDSELIMPLETLQTLAGNSQTVSFIELSFNSQSTNKTIASFSQTLPSNLKLTKIQQIQTFVADINTQTINFINVWSVAVYALIAAASYVIATRLVDEAKYELYMLRALGTKRKPVISLIISVILTIGFAGSLFGIALGIVGTQLAATGVRWIWGSFTLAPFLQPYQAFEILLIAFASCLIGSIYPAAKTSRTLAMENPQ